MGMGITIVIKLLIMVITAGITALYEFKPIERLSIIIILILLGTTSPGTWDFAEPAVAVFVVDYIMKNFK